MAKVDDLQKIIDLVAKKGELKKLARLKELIPELKTLDELVAHNAETAFDQVRQKADALMVSLPMDHRDVILQLLPRTNEEALQMASHLLSYHFPPKMIFFVHLDDVIMTDHDIPQIRPDASSAFKSLLQNNADLHLVVLSHDSADVTAVLVTMLTGAEAVNGGQVSMVYESGMGLYLGAETKEKKDYTGGIRAEISSVIERMAFAAASMMHDGEFNQRFYFSSTEFSVGIRVHPYARGLSKNLDKEAAHELLKCLAVALADIVKEDTAAVTTYAENIFLQNDPSLSVVFNHTTDERVWDMERVNHFLSALRFVHLGSRGSLIRPADVTDVPAVETIVDRAGGQCLLVGCSDSHFTLPLLQWLSKRQEGLIACSEGAEVAVRQLVEREGGIEYKAGDITDLTSILDTYQTFRRLASG